MTQVVLGLMGAGGEEKGVFQTLFAREKKRGTRLKKKRVKNSGLEFAFVSGLKEGLPEGEAEKSSLKGGEKKERDLLRAKEVILKERISNEPEKKDSRNGAYCQRGERAFSCFGRGGRGVAEEERAFLATEKGGRGAVFYSNG